MIGDYFKNANFFWNWQLTFRELSPRVSHSIMLTPKNGSDTSLAKCTLSVALSHLAHDNQTKRLEPEDTDKRYDIFSLKH